MMTSGIFGEHLFRIWEQSCWVVVEEERVGLVVVHGGMDQVPERLLLIDVTTGRPALALLFGHGAVLRVFSWRMTQFPHRAGDCRGTED